MASAIEFTNACAFLKKKPDEDDDKSCGVLNRLPTTPEELEAFFKVATYLSKKHAKVCEYSSFYEKEQEKYEFESDDEATNENEDDVSNNALIKKEEVFTHNVIVTSSVITKGEILKFNIRCPLNKNLHVEVSELNEIKHLKETLHRMFGFPVYRQLLVNSKENVLSNDSTLKDCNIKNGDELTLKLYVFE
jgi:uncharacterized ubiquitin-like protein YukD